MAVLLVGIIDVIFSIVFVIVGIILLIQIGQVKRNFTAKTNGTVTGIGSFDYGRGLKLPLVTYNIDGEDYKVEGPTFRNIRVAREDVDVVDGMFDTNIQDPLDPPEKLRVRLDEDSKAKSIMSTPIMRVYPRGTQLDVYYDPKKPERSYVLRYISAGKRTLGIVFIVAGIALAFVSYGVLTMAH